MVLKPGAVDAVPLGLRPLYHIRSGLSVVEVRLSAWRILDSSCGVDATRPVRSLEDAHGLIKYTVPPVLSSQRGSSSERR